MHRSSFSLAPKKLYPSSPAPTSRFPFFSPFTKALSLVALTVLLAACGGGDSQKLLDLQDAATSSDNTGGTTADNEVVRIGSGTGDNFTEGQLSAAQTELDAGESTLITINVFNQDNEPPLGEYTINFTSPCVAGGLASFENSTTVSAGLYTVEYHAKGCSGTDKVTARIEGSNKSASVELTVIPPEVLTVSFVDSTLTQLSLAGIGGDESTEVTFKVAGPQDVPIIGADVTFSINSSVGGANILAGRETGTTDQNGEVRTILKSGTVAGPVNVRAVHNATGLQGVSDDIVISTGVPEYSRFSVSYDHFNPPEAFHTDGIEVSISIIASDQFGNNPTDGTRISFVAPESGNVINSCDLQDGSCSVNWRSTSPRPADGRLEIIAYTDGAEDFVDNNGNSVYDAGDGAIIDLGEPYADENENGSYDVGEFFFDSNRNGVWDTGNGKWDGPCLDKVDTSAVCTGESTVSIFDTVTVVMSTNSPRLLTAGTFGAVGGTINLNQGNIRDLSGIIVADSNTNADPLGSNPMPYGTTITFSYEGTGVSFVGANSYEVVNTTAPTGPYAVSLKAEAVDPADALPDPGRLILTIDPPNASATQFSWNVSVLR